MKEDKTKYVFIFLFIALMTLSFFIIKPYITPIIAGLMMGLVFYPVYKFLVKKLKRENLCALITTILALLLILGPMIIIFQQLGYQAKVAYVLTKQRVISGNLLGEEVCNTDNVLCDLNKYFLQMSEKEDFIYQRNEFINYFESLLWKNTPNLVVAVPKVILFFFLMSVVMFYSLREGRGIFKRIENMVPLKPKHKNRLFKRLREVSNAVIYGHIIAGLSQGVVGIIGLYIFNVTNPILLGIVMTFSAFLPIFGTTLVWLPLSVLKVFEGVSSQNNVAIYNGIGLFLYGFFVISLVDNFIKPKIVGDRADVNPIIILLGLLGGLAIFGLVGLIVGPLVLATTMTMIDIYEADKDEITG